MFPLEIFKCTLHYHQSIFNKHDVSRSHILSSSRVTQWKSSPIIYDYEHYEKVMRSTVCSVRILYVLCKRLQHDTNTWLLWWVQMCSSDIRYTGNQNFTTFNAHTSNFVPISLTGAFCQIWKIKMNKLFLFHFDRESQNN